MTPPSIHVRKYLELLGSILPNGRLFLSVSAGGGLRDDMVSSPTIWKEMRQSRQRISQSEPQWLCIAQGAEAVGPESGWDVVLAEACGAVAQMRGVGSVMGAIRTTKRKEHESLPNSFLRETHCTSNSSSSSSSNQQKSRETFKLCYRCIGRACFPQLPTLPSSTVPHSVLVISFPISCRPTVDSQLVATFNPAPVFLGPLAVVQVPI